MAAPVAIANSALVLIGQDPIISLDEGNKRAIACKAQYDIARQAEIRANRWGFSMKRAALAALATPPISQFDFAYAMPADLLRLDYVGDTFVGLSLTDYRTTDESEFAIEGREILTSKAAPLNIRYQYDVTDGSKFDALFTDAFAHTLALKVTETLRASVPKLLPEMYAQVISRAYQVNAIERPPVPLADDSWIMSRL
jgi:hypothetical protein